MAISDKLFRVLDSTIANSGLIVGLYVSKK